MHAALLLFCKVFNGENVEQNIVAAWMAFLFGAPAGAVTGLLFHDEAWLGGYDSWRRRLMRLGHVAFFWVFGVADFIFFLLMFSCWRMIRRAAA